MVEREMQRQKYFLEPGLTLDSLSRKVGTNRSYLSQVIYGVAGCNFCTYINRLRMEELMHCGDDAMESENALYDRALHCGFNSKRNFNRVFLREMGMLPCDFVAMYKNSINFVTDF